MSTNKNILAEGLRLRAMMRWNDMIIDGKVEGDSVRRRFADDRGKRSDQGIHTGEIKGVSRGRFTQGEAIEG